MSAAPFGRHPTTGEDVTRFTLAHAGEGGLRVSIIDLGATITSVLCPDKDGSNDEITLGFDEAAPYGNGTSPYFGCVAGRYANRIAKGSFVLDGKAVSIHTNNGPNHLHGGLVGFDKRMWKAVEHTPTSLKLELTSSDGDEGYPGTLTATVVYSLPTPMCLRIEYSASTDAPTVCNLTNHTYWNLKDGGASAVTEHVISLEADFYTPVDDTSIPTGEIKPVAGAMDLTKPVSIGEGLAAADNGMGYDHNYCLRGPMGSDGLQEVGRVWEPSTGRAMTVRTDQPGVQFYTGNYLDGLAGHGGRVYARNHGFCLETQRFPDSPNRPHFPSATLRPREHYSHTTVHTFSIADK